MADNLDDYSGGLVVICQGQAIEPKEEEEDEHVDYYDGKCAECGWPFHWSTKDFPFPCKREFTAGSEVPLIPKSSPVLGECPMCFSLIIAVYETKHRDKTEFERWDAARQANLRNPQFFSKNPMPRSHHYLVKFK